MIIFRKNLTLITTVFIVMCIVTANSAAAKKTNWGWTKPKEKDFESGLFGPVSVKYRN